MTTYPKFKIKVLLNNRKDTIESHMYGSRDEAEADLIKITDARTQNTEVGLPWLQLPGNQVQAAYVEDRTTSISIA